MEIRRLDEASFRDDKLSKVNLFETPRFFCDLYCLRPGQSQAVHSHAAEDKVYLVVRGRAVVTLGEEEREMAEGELVLAPAGVAHGVRNEGPEELVCLVTMAPHPSPPTGV